MLRSDEDVEKLLTHTNNGLNKVNVQVKIIGSGNHGNQSSEGKKAGHQMRNKDDQATTAILAELIGGNKAAELMGSQPATVSRFRDGLNGNGDPDPVLKARIEDRLNGVNDKLTDKLDILIDMFNEDKMKELKASEIPPSAEKLVNIYDKINRRHEKNGDNGILRPQLVLYAPKQINITELITKEV